MLAKQLKMKQNKQNEQFLSMLLGTFGTILLRNLLTGKGTIRAGEGDIARGQGRGAIIADQSF